MVRNVRLAGSLGLMLLGAGCSGQQGTSGASATGGSTETGSGSAASCVGPYLNDEPPSGVLRGPL